MGKADLDDVLAINTVFWDQAADLVANGYRINAYLREGIKGYHVTFSKSGESKTLVVIDKRTSMAAPATVDGSTLFQTLATHSDVDCLTLPLVPYGQEPEHHKKSIVRMQRPNPKILWTLEVDGKPLIGERNKPKRLDTLISILELATFASATTADLPITPPMRQYFQARYQRSQWISEELAKRDLNLRTWCLENGEKYQTYYIALHRGDNLPKEKDQLAKIAKRKKSEMWPNIDWS